MRIEGIQILASTSIASAMLFVPIFAKEIGSKDWQIGIIVASYGLASFLSSFIFGRFADVHGKKIVINIGLFFAAVTSFLLAFANTPFLFSILRFLNGFSTGMFFSAVVVYAYELRRKLGGFISLSSLSWIFGQAVAGVLAVQKNVFLFGGLCFLAAFFFSLFIQRDKNKVYVEKMPVRIIRKNFSVYLPFMLRHIGAHMAWAILPVYLYITVGIPKIGISIIYITNHITQFFVFRRIENVDPIKSMRIGILLTSLGMFLFSQTKNIYHGIFSNAVLGSGWAFLYLGTLNYLTKKNIEKTTAVGILHSIQGFCLALGPILGGFSAEFFGYRATLILASIISFSAFLISLFIKDHSRN